MKPDDRIKLGVIGAGFVSQICHLPCFDAIFDFQVDAICDPRVTLATKVASRYEIPSVFGSHLEMLENVDIDAALIVLPRPLTANVVRDCLKKKVSVLAEKPLMLNQLTGLELCSHADESTNVMVGYMKRFDPGVSLFRELTNECLETEELLHVQVSSCMGDSYCSPFGDVKSTEARTLVSREEIFPSTIPAEYWWGYEQFLNVFCHMLDLVEFVRNDHLRFTFANVGKHGTGQLCANFQSSKEPVSFKLLRGKQMAWRESLEFTFETKTVSLNLSPPFLRNMPSEVIHEFGIGFSERRVIRPNYGWAFMEQAKGFASYIKEEKKSSEYLNAAIRHASCVEEIFTNHVVREKSS